MHHHKWIFIIIFTVSFNAGLLVNPARTWSETNESGDFIIAEDWDVGTPPSGWPQCGGSSWHGWTPKNYDCDQYSKGELSTTRYYTAPRSLHLSRIDGVPESLDVSQEFSSQKKVHVRAYLYFDKSYANSNGTEDQAHFIFFNTAVAFSSMGVDFRRYSDQYHSWPPICNPNNSQALYFTLRTTANCNGGEDAYGSSDASKCFNILDHLGEWILFEVMWDLNNNRGKIWVNEDLIIDREICITSQTSIKKLIFSLWDSQNKTAHDLYIDNIAVSTSYIGPIKDSGSTSPPSEEEEPSVVLDPPKNLRIFN